MSRDADLRDQVLSWFADRSAEGLERVTRNELTEFSIGNDPLPLIDVGRGIRNPVQLDATISIISKPDSPYADEPFGAGYYRYSFAPGPVDRGDNAKLLEAMRLGVRIVLLLWAAPNVYAPVYPVFVVGVDLAERFFIIALEEAQRFAPVPVGPVSELERRYAEALIRRRVHQPRFSAQVRLAYQDHCAICKLELPALLDAAHILGDKHERGQPVVPNGLTLCKIHHAAFDANILGITPDYVVHVNQEVLQQIDGPMLRHGIQDMHGRELLWVPKRVQDRPDQERLAERYRDFTGAA